MPLLLLVIVVVRVFLIRHTVFHSQSAKESPHGDASGTTPITNGHHTNESRDLRGHWTNDQSAYTIANIYICIGLEGIVRHLLYAYIC